MSLLSELHQALHEIILEKPEQEGRATVYGGGWKCIQVPQYEMNQNLLKTGWHQESKMEPKLISSSSRSCQ